MLNHGHIDLDTYFPGQGMPREHDYLARHGYVVLHTDYRGHASDNDKNVDYTWLLAWRHDQCGEGGQARICGSWTRIGSAGSDAPWAAASP